MNHGRSWRKFASDAISPALEQNIEQPEGALAPQVAGRVGGEVGCGRSSRELTGPAWPCPLPRP
jgi:hypothetical protein